MRTKDILALFKHMNEEILKYAIENGMIDLSYVQDQIEMSERKKYLQMHKYKVWQGKDGYFYTKVVDDSKQNNRRMIKKSKISALEDAIINYYKQKEKERDPNIKDVFEEWINQKMRYGEIQRQTYERYKMDFKRFFDDIKDRKIRFISENELEEFIKLSIHDKQLTAKAWGNFRTILRGMFKYAKKNGYTKISITSFLGDLDISNKIFTKKIKPDECCVFCENEMQLLVKYLINKPTLGNLGVLVAAYTGMRVGEVAALKWSDINDQYIYVHSTQIRYHDDNGKDIYEIKNSPKTDAGIRKVVIVENLHSVIKRIRKINPFTEYVFEKNGKTLTKHAFEMCLYRACDNLGIPRRSMHVLRKTYATRLINSNVEESIIINQMGHTDIATTKQYYYYNDKTFNAIADAVGKVINY